MSIFVQFTLKLVNYRNEIHLAAMKTRRLPTPIKVKYFDDSTLAAFLPAEIRTFSYQSNKRPSEDFASHRMPLTHCMYFVAGN